MSYQRLDHDFGEQNNRSSSTYSKQLHDIPPASLPVPVVYAPPTSTSSASLQAPAVPQILSAPSAPPPSSSPDLYGAERLYRHRRAVAYHVPNPVHPRQLSEQPVAMAGYNPSAGSEFKDELARLVDASVTPGVDNTPYIQYALDALTRPPEEGRGQSGNTPSSNGEGNPMMRWMPNAVPGLFSRQRQPQRDTARAEEGVPLRQPRPEPRITEEHQAAESGPSPEDELLARRLQRAREARRDSGEVRLPYTPEPYDEWRWSNLADPDHPFWSPNVSIPEERLPRSVNYWQAIGDDARDPEKARSNPPLFWKPWILRTWSLLFYLVHCVIVVGLLIFCVVKSDRHKGFVAYSGHNAGGQYFLFRILPQLIAAPFIIYAQGIITTTFRVLPFSVMASNDSRLRRNAGFLPLYPKSFLWPQISAGSSWQVMIPIVVVWLFNFTLPLQSSLFTVVLVDGTWKWSTVQGVAWTLVALYIMMTISTGIQILFWHNRRTGMLPKWDLRTLADYIFLVSQSNTLQDYRGSETAPGRAAMERLLGGNDQRLGYWFAPEAPENRRWYGIGLATNEKTAEKEKLAHMQEGDKEAESRFLNPERDPRPVPSGSTVRTRYLPWGIRTSQVILWVVAASILLLALLVVSFDHTTDVRSGFLPLLESAPKPGAFSPANFLYSFLPALLGTVVFLAFQSLDLTLRILTPWGELSRQEGATARQSILLDYAACLPFESTYKALKNRHWRVAFLSFLSVLFILIPVLAGGVFMALTPHDGIVRMYPNIPAYALLLTLLFLYLFGLISLIPHRAQFRLPHAVTCLAEIISFCYNEELRTDEAFLYPGNKRDLKGKVGAFDDPEYMARWYFGSGKKGDERLGIKRVEKFTANPKTVEAKERAARLRNRAREALLRAHGISRPVPQGNSLMT